MLAVFYLHPIWRRAGTIWPVSTFRNQALQPELAGFPKQVRPDLALFEWSDEDALTATGQEPRQIGFAHRARKLPHVIAVASKHVKGVELNFVIMLSGMQRVEV